MREPFSKERVLSVLCALLNKREIRYERLRKRAGVAFSLSLSEEEASPLVFHLMIDENSRQIRLYCLLPDRFGPEAVADVSVAAAAANFALAHGCFDFLMTEGIVIFELVNTCIGIEADAGLFDYLLGLSVATLSRYAPLFHGLHEGTLGVQAFLK